MRQVFIQSILISSLLFSAVAQIAVAQTCRDFIPNLNPNSRYIDNGNSTVTDKGTGLMWKQCVEGFSGTSCTTIGSVFTYVWQDALELATMVNTAGFAGHTDWRVPNLTELESLLTQNCVNPSINASLFPNVSYSVVWSSSPSSGRGAWGVYFSGGNISDFDRSKVNYVRLVRSGQ